MSLPIDVMEIIVSKMTYQDVLTYPNIENIRQVILLCPEEWHTHLSEYVKYVRDISNVKIDTFQVDSYLTIEDVDVRNNASLTNDKNRTNLFSLQKICDGLLAKYETTYNWRVKQFHYLLNDDVNWNTDNIKTILHEVLLYYCYRLGFNRNIIMQKINLLKPYIQGLLCFTSKSYMQKKIFQFIINDFYEGNAKLLYIFITEGEDKIQVSIWNDYCAQILHYVEEQQALKNRLNNISASMNWNVDNIKNILGICTEHSLMVTVNCHDAIISHVIGEISYNKVRRILLTDKLERYKRLCTERLLSLGISSYYFSDLFYWECFDEFYQSNAIDKFVNTVEDICQIRNIIIKNEIEMVEGILYKNDISIDDYVSYEVWYKVIVDCISIHNDSNVNIDIYDIVAFIQGLFKRLFKLKKALKRKGLSLNKNKKLEICRNYIENGEGNIRSIIKSLQNNTI